jgi:hypothetical protein
MWLTRVTITPRYRTTPALDAALLVDAIWAGVVAADRVEHITALRRPGRIEIGVFTLPLDDAAAFAAVRTVVERALLRSPLLRQWVISEPRPLTPFPDVAQETATDMRSPNPGAEEARNDTQRQGRPASS